MTFDARKGSAPSGSGRQNLLFGGLTLAVVCGAFFAVLSLPHAGDKPARPHSDILAAADAAVPRLPGKAAEAYYEALGRIDAEAQADLSRQIARAGKTGEAELAKMIMVHAGEVLQAHAGELAMADTKHVDRVLDLARDRLRMASGKRSKWCEATRYTYLQQIEFRKPDEWQRELAELEEPMRDFTFEALAGFMVAIEDARERPVRRGTMTRADEAALQGVMMSIIADPEMRPILLASQSGGDAAEALKGVNVCNLAATAVTAAKTLPQETKGRLLAEAMKNMEKNGPDAFARGVSF